MSDYVVIVSQPLGRLLPHQMSSFSDGYSTPCRFCRKWLRNSEYRLYMPCPAREYDVDNPIEDTTHAQK